MTTAASVPAPMVQLPAETVEKLRTTHTRWEVSDSDDAQATLNLVAAVRAVVDAATPAASVPIDPEQTMADLLPICDAYTRGEELTSQQIDVFHTLANMTTVRWLIRTVYGMTSHRDSLQRQLAASVPAADKLEALREAVANYRTATVARFQMGQTADPMTEIELAAGAFVDAVAAAERADKGEAADTPRYDDDLFADLAGHPDDTPMSGEAAIQYAPVAPVGGSLPEGWHHIPWTSKEDGVGAPETPASGESGPPAPPALCVGCGHDVGLHNEKGCLHGWAGPEGLCRCRLDGSQAPPVPVNDEAEAPSRDELIELVGDALGHSVEGCTCFADGTNQMCAVCIPVAVAIVDALAARQGGSSDE